MKKYRIQKTLVMTTILLLICNITSLAYGVNDASEQKMSGLNRQNEVFVNDDYNETTPDWNIINFSTIQDAIDAVDVGWTVNVRNGTYNESVTVKNKITLIGINEDEYGNDTYRPRISDPATGILVIGKNASETDISGFDIINCNVAGIFIMFADSVNIHENKIMTNGKGIYAIQSKSCSIELNVVENNIYEGIYIAYSDNSNIEGNYIRYNGRSGIEVYDSNTVSISKNTIAWNGNNTKRNYNLWLQSNDIGNIITENDIFDSENYSRLRFLESSWQNNWNDNYWNKHTGGRIYLIWGRNSIIFFSLILGYKIQFDRSPQDAPYNYTCPVI